MPEWKNLSVETKNGMLQIPEDELKSMPTEMLVQAYIDNPFCSLIFVYNTVQDGFNRVYDEFSGLRELVRRDDAALEIVSFYKNMQVDGYDRNWESNKIGKFTFKFIYVEALLSQSEIISQLNQNETKMLTNELLKKYNDKIKHVSEHSIVGLESSAYAIAHILYQNGKLSQPGKKLDDATNIFLETGRIPRNDILDNIIQKAELFIQN